MAMPEKASEKLLPAFLFVFVAEVSDLIRVISPVFFDLHPQFQMDFGIQQLLDLKTGRSQSP